AYLATCTAAGGTAPYHWSTGTLPAGIKLSATTGAIVTIGGTPTATGSYNYQVQVTDSSAPPQTAPPQTYTGTILPTGLTFSCTPTTTRLCVGLAYSATCTAAGGTAVYHWSTGTLPAGIALSAATGATVMIRGTPTTPGTYNYQ